MDPERDLSELHEDILATSEDIEADAVKLKELENQKAKVAAGDPDLVAMSEAAEDLAESIKAKASTETALAKDAVASTDSLGTPEGGAERRSATGAVPER